MRVLNPATTFKLAALAHQYARCGHVQNKGRVDVIVRPLSLWSRNPFDRSLALYTQSRNASDEREVPGNRSVCAPEFFAVHQEMGAGGIQHRLGSHIGRIRAGHRFCEGKGRKGLLRDEREVFFLLVRVSEEEDRHGDTDGLRHCHRQSQNVAPAGNQRQDPAVVRIGQAEPAIFFGNFHTEGPELEQPLDDAFVNFGLAFDFLRVHLMNQKVFDLFAEGLAGSFLFRRFGRCQQEAEVRPAVIETGQETLSGESLAGFFDPFETCKEGAHVVPHPIWSTGIFELPVTILGQGAR